MSNREDSRLDMKVFVVMMTWVIAAMLLINSSLSTATAAAIIATMGLIPSAGMVYYRHKLHESEASFLRIAGERNLLEAYFSRFVPREVRQAHLDETLTALAKICESTQNQLKLFSEGGLAALGLTQERGESNATYIERARNRGQNLQFYYEEAVRSFEAHYDHAESVRRLVGITLRDRNFENYLTQEEKTASAA